MRRSPKPVSLKQLAANRANATKSTGPQTPEGKARSAQNSLKHGFTASTFAVVRLEDLQEIARLKSDLVSVYRPVNSQELFALERMALSHQAIGHRHGDDAPWAGMGVGNAKAAPLRLGACLAVLRQSVFRSIGIAIGPAAG